MRSAPWVHRVLTGLVTLALLWVVFGLIVGGRPLWGTAALLLGAGVIYLYASARTLAWKYLFPGVAGMLLFVVFPLAYTMQIGFTNYSSSNLLTRSARARLPAGPDRSRRRRDAALHAAPARQRASPCLAGHRRQRDGVAGAEPGARRAARHATRSGAHRRSADAARGAAASTCLDGHHPEAAEWRAAELCRRARVRAGRAALDRQRRRVLAAACHRHPVPTRPSAAATS